MGGLTASGHAANAVRARASRSCRAIPDAEAPSLRLAALQYLTLGAVAVEGAPHRQWIRRADTLPPAFNQGLQFLTATPTPDDPTGHIVRFWPHWRNPPSLPRCSPITTDAGKKIVGRKRGVITDALGLILAVTVTVTAASLSDNAIGIRLLD